MAEPGALVTLLMELLDDCDEEFEEDNDGSCVILHMASVTAVQDERTRCCTTSNAIHVMCK